MNKESKIVEEAIRRAGDDGERGRLAEEGRLEAGIEALRSVAQLDEEAAAERLAARLSALAGRRRRSAFRIGGGVAAAAALVALLVGSLQWLKREPQVLVPQLPSLQVGEIRVPTLLHEQDSRIVACEALETAGEPLYVAASAADSVREAQAPAAVTYRTLVIPAGYTYTVALADGSTVILNAGSELRFPDRFADSLRRVELKGEAYFRVVKGEAPFVVAGGGAEVRVYGTQFNFLSSGRLGVTEAVLVEGSIGMRAGGQELRITPNRRIAYREGQPLEVEEVDPAAYTAWLHGAFRYRGMPLDRIADDIARWYGIEIVLAPELGKQVFTLEFDKSATLEWTLRALEKIVGKPVKKEGGIYTIK
ncbi:MAG: FecR domain-containing protein [Odoribacter sp.]|nr:FecR domain-containing protein [Odoribacter sp.]